MTPLIDTCARAADELRSVLGEWAFAETRLEWLHHWHTHVARALATERCGITFEQHEYVLSLRPRCAADKALNQTWTEAYRQARTDVPCTIPDLLGYCDRLVRDAAMVA